MVNIWKSLKMSSSALFIKNVFYFLCVLMFCLHVCLHNTRVLGAQGSQKRVLDPQEVELQIVVSNQMGAGT